MEIASSGGYSRAVLAFEVGGVSEFWGHLPGKECRNHVVCEFTDHSVPTLHSAEEEAAGWMAA